MGDHRLPYVGYVEATVEIPFVDCSDLLVPVLVVPPTEYNYNVPVVIGTNIIRLCKEVTEDDIDVPQAWEVAFQVDVLAYTVDVLAQSDQLRAEPSKSDQWKR